MTHRANGFCPSNADRSEMFIKTTKRNEINNFLKALLIISHYS